CSMKRPCTKLLVVAFFCEEAFCLFRQFKRKTKIVQTLQHAFHQNIDDLENVFFVQTIEDDHIVDPVQEFGRECTLQGLLDHGLICFVGGLHPGCSSKSNSIAKIFQLANANI